MKKIIASILVAVMLVFTLASCSYSFAKDDLGKYATFSAEDKAAFEEALKALIIKDGDFTADEETREKKVLDDLYEGLASAVSKDDKSTAGVAGAHDLIYYCYYCTADFDGKEVIVFASNMKAANAVNIQLGQLDVETLGEEFYKNFPENFDFTDKIYESKTEGTAGEGDVVFVSYTASWSEKNSEDVSETKTEKAVSHMMTVGAAPAEEGVYSSLAEYFNGKAVNTTLDNVKITEGDKGEVSYSSVKIEWIASGDPLMSFTDKTFDVEKKVTDSLNQSRDLKDKDLTYHIYPIGYISVPEYNAETVVNELLGKNISLDSITEVLFGRKYADKTDEEKADILKAYVSKDGDKDVSLEELVNKIAELQTTLAEKKEALTKAKTTYDEKLEAYDEAKAKVDAAGSSATDAQKSTLSKAETAKDSAKTDYDKAKTEYDDAKKARDEKTAVLLAFDGIKDKLVDGFKTATYEYLRDAYNDEIKMNLAKEVYYFMEKYVKVTSVPEKAVDASYDQMIQNYQYEFRTGKDSTSSESYYKKYNGSFKDFLVKEVSTDIKSVTTYDEALAAIRQKAESYVEPIVRIYVLAKAYNVLVTEDEWDEYVDDPENSYSYNEYSYGENSVRYAHQFDKLMNYILDSDEEDGKVTYKNFGIGNYKTEGTPASEAGETE